MQILRLVLLFVHLVAVGGIVGTLLAQLRTQPRVVTAVMVNSARVAFLAGLLVVGVLEMSDVDVDHAKIGVKLLVGLVIVGILEAMRKRARLSDAAYFGVLGLTLLNIAVAVFWTPAHGSY